MNITDQFIAMETRTFKPSSESACADPESFARGGPSLTMFIIIIIINIIIIIIVMGERICWQANDGPTFDAALVALRFSSGSGPVNAKKPYIFVIFQGGGGSGPTVPPPSWSAHGH